MKTKNRDFSEQLVDFTKHERIATLIDSLQITEDEIKTFLPVFLLMEEEELAENKPFYITTLDRDKNNELFITKILSHIGEKKAFIHNIVSLKYHQVNFDIDQEFDKKIWKKEIVSQFADLINNKETQNGIYFYGSTNGGKTFLIKRLAKIAAEKNKKVFIMPTNEIWSTVRNDFDLKVPLIKEMKNVDYLFLDDFGGENITTWFRDEMLYLILSYRVQNKKPTIVASSYSLEKLQKVEEKTEGAWKADNLKAERLISVIKNYYKVYKAETKD